MADERKFKFIAPGVFINEIDRSQIPALAEAIGPLIIGRAQKGPSMVPVKVNSYAEFVNIFGEPEPGTLQVSDVWRSGGHNAPLYGAYAAKAALSVGTAPITFVRLAGTQATTAATDGRAKAGWYLPQLPTSISTAATSYKGAFGLYMIKGTADVVQVGAGNQLTGSFTGTLGAILYTNGAAIYPSASINIGAATSGIQGMNKIVPTATTQTQDITLVISGSGGATKKTINLNRDSDKFIRKQLNTNPQKISSRESGITTIEPDTTNYWVGETYERNISDFVSQAGNNIFYYAVMPLANPAYTSDKANHQAEYVDAQTPWFISQHLDSSAFTTYNPSSMEKLFKFVSLDGQGDWCSRNLKISIENIRYSVNENADYGSFDVVLRAAQDTDLKQTVLERFNSVNLNPNSPDFIVSRIGDQYHKFDTTTNQIRTINDFPNLSRYIRVVVSANVKNGTTPKESLPFGFHGLVKLADASSTLIAPSMTFGASNYYAEEGFLSDATVLLSASNGLATASILMPGIPYRVSASAGGASHLSAYFGVDTGRSSTNLVFNDGYIDYTRFMGTDIISSFGDDFGYSGTPDGGTEFQYGFSLDELSASVASTYSITDSPTQNVISVAWVSGSRAAGTAFNNGAVSPSIAASYKNILKLGVKGFTAPMFGGFDGLNIYEREPLRNTYIGGDTDPSNNHVLATFQRAIDTVADPEFVEYNVLTVPGLVNSSLTKRMIDVCENRGDAIAVIDLENSYLPEHEVNVSAASRISNINQVLTSYDARNLNSTYAATYYPWVTVRDDSSGTFIKVPPSVVALGVLQNTERVADVWFAPAGFNRGGLSNGGAGLSVTGVEYRLTSKEREDLYNRSINPIASFPSEGIVIYGQKTMQVSPISALSRINVRRLMIYLKKGISRIASTVLFEQNVQATWTDFKTRAESFLGDVRVRLGLEDFRVILDETTTTADLVDRNIMYAKIYVKPTRSIEFIALDFIITRAGASFED